MIPVFRLGTYERLNDVRCRNVLCIIAHKRETCDNVNACQNGRWFLIDVFMFLVTNGKEPTLVCCLQVRPYE
jgi:hypothetical protein